MNEQARPANPYPGLRPFHFSESRLFFGRERQSLELLRKLRRNRFLAVVGTSGSGKSSLVRAGLLPLLDRGFAADAGERWRIALFRPGKNPINNLAVALNSPEAFRLPYAASDGRDSKTAEEWESEQLKASVIETILRRSALGLAEHARRVAGGARENLLVCVDQFEELFRFKEKSERSNPEDEAAAFVKLLLEAARDKGVAVYVLLTMRSDFLGECSQFRDLPEAINEGQYLIPRMTRDEQREAIAEPATLFGAGLSPRLVQRLLNDVGDNPDQLPLLQHALMRTWEHWREGGGEGAIDLEHYRFVGGMENALSKHAQQTYDALPDARSRDIAEKLFKALTETVVNNREIRRPAEMSELCGVCATDAAEVVPVVDHFRDLGRSFLMPPPGTELTGDTVIDISHESLIKGWELLRKWVEDEAKSKAMYQRVADAARRRYREEESAGLWRDPDLRFALEWLERERPNAAWASRYDPHFEDALRFLKESKEEREREREEREAKLLAERQREERAYQRELALAQEAALGQQRIAEAERERAEEAKRREDAERERAEERSRFARNLKVAVALLVVMLFVTTGFAVYAFSQRDQALGQKQRADDNAADLATTANELAVKSHALREELKKSRQLSDERETARQQAALGEQRAKEAEAKAEDNAKKLQAALDTANTARENEKKAREREDTARTREDLERGGLISLEKGDAKQAVENFQTLLAEYEKDSSREGQIAASWANYNLGTALRQDKNYLAALESYTKAGERQKKVFDNGSPEFVPVMSRLAQTAHDLGDYETANNIYDSFEILLKSLEKRAADRNDTAGQYAYRERLTGVKRERAKLYQDEARDLGIQAQQKEKERNALSEQVNRLRALSGDAALTAEVKSFNEGVLEQSQLEGARLDKKKDELIESSRKKYAAAEEMYNKVAEDRESLLPAGSLIDLVEAYNDLAAFNQDRASFEEDFSSAESAEAKTESAKQFYKLARTVRKSKLRPDDMSETEATKLEALASELDDQKRYVAVTAISRRALNIWEGVAEKAGKDTPARLRADLSRAKALATIVHSLYESNREAEAKPYYEEALTLLRAIAARPAADLKLKRGEFSLSSVVSSLYQRKAYAEAQKILALEIDILQKVLTNYEEKHTRASAASGLASILTSLSILEIKLKNYPAAVDDLEKGLDIIRRELGPESEADYSVAFFLGKLYFKRERYGDALPQLQRVLAIFGSRLGPQQRASRPGGREQLFLTMTKQWSLYAPPSYYLGALQGAAEVLSKLGRDEEAEMNYKELLAASEWVIENGRSFALSDEKRVKEFRDEYEGIYAGALESYAAFLKRPEVGRAAEAKPFEDRAAEIRSRLGPKKEDPIFN